MGCCCAFVQLVGVAGVFFASLMAQASDRVPKKLAFFEYLTAMPRPALVAFNPTDYDPRDRKRPLPSAESIREDLAALRPAFDGLILYAYDKELTPLVLAEAKRLNYRAVLLGIYTLSEEELQGTAALVKQHSKDLALSVCIGNEGIAFNRYSIEQVIAARRRLVALLGPNTAVPLTTSEPLSKYDLPFLREFADFLCPNIHPAFDRPNDTPSEAARWARSRAVALAKATGKCVLIKETGLPHGGDARFSPAVQREFWETYTGLGHLEKIADDRAWVSCAAAFEAFDMDWKAVQSGMKIEGAWGLMDKNRTPYPAFSVWRQLGQPRGEANERRVPMQSNRFDLAYAFLAAEMDRWTTGAVVYDEFSSGAAGFYPINRDGNGDIADATLDERCVDSPAIGTTCLKLTYKPDGPKGWSAITWAYPDRPGPNWGEAAGRVVTGATCLRGLVRGAVGGEVIKLSIGGINRWPYHDNRKLFQDEFDPIRISVRLTKEWRQFELKIPADVARRAPLRIIGGFTFAVESRENRGGCTVYFDDLKYDNNQQDELRLIRSYVPTVSREDDDIRNVAYLYDNCLAILAFLAQGDADSLRRSKILADSLVWAQMHDRAGGSKFMPWRNGYSCGPLVDEATDTARMPGLYDLKKNRIIEDRYTVSSDTGNQAWSIIALLTAHNKLEAGKQQDYPYLQSALLAANWIEANCRVDDKVGGYSGGLEGWEKTPAHPQGQTKLAWRSTEHCIDLYVAFRKLAIALDEAQRRDPTNWANKNDGKWMQRAHHARAFVLAMWNAQGQFFWTGVRDSKGTINQDAVPLDVQTWSLLALGHDPEFRRTIGWTGLPQLPSMLYWVQQHCSASGPTGESGYRFSNRGKGLWFEGSGQMAACARYLDRNTASQNILQKVASLHDSTKSSESSGAILAAFREPAETGFLKDFGPDENGKPVVKMWRYLPRPHIGATAWFLLGAKGNPYWLEGLPAENH